jgi:hypothetical protein
MLGWPPRLGRYLLMGRRPTSKRCSSSQKPHISKASTSPAISTARGRVPVIHQTLNLNPLFTSSFNSVQPLPDTTIDYSSVPLPSVAQMWAAVSRRQILHPLSSPAAVSTPLSNGVSPSLNARPRSDGARALAANCCFAPYALLELGYLEQKQEFCVAS